MHEDLCEQFETETQPEPAAIEDEAVAQELRVLLSRQLMRKLRDTARDEGVDLAALVGELLAEGVTLRAWEIVERKSAMRGHAGGNPAPHGNQRFGNGNGRGPNERNGNDRFGGGRGPNDRYAGRQPNGNRRSGGGAPNNAWMEDKAAFLEYVRNQEKQRRR